MSILPSWRLLRELKERGFELEMDEWECCLVKTKVKGMHWPLILCHSLFPFSFLFWVWRVSDVNEMLDHVHVNLVSCLEVYPGWMNTGWGHSAVSFGWAASMLPRASKVESRRLCAGLWMLDLNRGLRQMRIGSHFSSFFFLRMFLVFQCWCDHVHRAWSMSDRMLIVLLKATSFIDITTFGDHRSACDADVRPSWMFVFQDPSDDQRFKEVNQCDFQRDEGSLLHSLSIWCLACTLAWVVVCVHGCWAWRALLSLLLKTCGRQGWKLSWWTQSFKRMEKKTKKT